VAKFVVLPTNQRERLEAKIQDSEFGNDVIELPNGEWLISYDGTSKQLCEYLGIAQPENSINGIVLSISGYWGRAPSDVWEWLSRSDD